MTNNPSRFFRKVLKNSFLVTASSAALLFTGGNAFAAPRTVVANAAFDTGDGLDPLGPPLTPFATGSTLKYNDDGFTVNANLAVAIAGVDLADKAPADFTVNENISLGAVTDSKGLKKLPLTISDTFTLTLDGTDGFGAGAVDEYTALGALTFPAAGGAGTLNVNTADGGVITLSSAINNGAQATLNATTQVKFTDNSAANINTINIGAATNVDLDTINADFTILPTANSKINFGDNNSALGILNSSAVDDTTALLGNDLDPGAVNKGQVFLVSKNGKALTLRGEVGGKKLGIAGGNVLQLLGITGKVNILGGAGTLLDVSGSKTLNIYNGATFTDQSATSAAIKAINIGAGGVPGAATYVLDAQGGDFGILTNGGDAINFADAASTLMLQNTSAANDRVITLNANLSGGVTLPPAPVAGNGGIVTLSSTGGKLLTVQGAAGGETLGTAANKLNALNIAGEVTVNGVAGNALDVSNALVLNVYNGATFTDNSATSAAIKAINIGAALPAGGKAGKATYVLDAQGGDFGILTNGGDAINFADAASTLMLKNTSAANDRVITLNANLSGGVTLPPAPVAGNGGIVTLSSTGGKLLTVQGAAGGETLGTAANQLNALNIAGKVTVNGVAGNALDVNNALVLNVCNGATFTDNSATSAAIKAINIGAALPAGGKAGKATYIVDVSTAVAPVNFLAVGAGNTLNFLSADSILTVQNTAGADKTVVFNNNVIGINNGGGNGGGIINLTSTNPANSLIVSGKGTQRLGNTNNLAQLNITGNVIVTGAAGNKLNVSGFDLLNVYNGALFTDNSATSAAIKTINIGTELPAGGGVGKATYMVDVSTAAGAVNFLTANVGNTLNFLSADSILTVQNTAGDDKTVVFNNNVVGINNGGGNGGGIVNLKSTGGGALIVSGNGAAVQQLGNGNNLAALNITGNVLVTGKSAGGAGDNKLDISRSDALNIYNGALLLDESATSVAIKAINIGADAKGGAGAGPATYAIDAVNSNFTILDAGATIMFVDADSKLIIQNSANADRIVTLAANLDPGAAAKGVVLLGSTNANTLFLQGAAGGVTLGAGANTLKMLGVSGKVVNSFNGGGNIDLSRAETLNVYNGALFSDQNATSAAINTINIGANAGDGNGVGSAIYSIDISKQVAGDVNILAGGNIKFLNANAAFGIDNTAAPSPRTIIFNNNIAGGVQGVGGNGGIVYLRSDADAANTLTVQSIDGTKTLGIIGNKLAELGIIGNVTLDNTANKSLIVNNALTLNVYNGATFTDKNLSSTTIAAINIGAKFNNAGIVSAAGPATYVIDVSNKGAAVVLPGNNVKFADAGATLKIQNTAATNEIVTLNDNIVGGVAGVAGAGGIVELNANKAGGASKLTIAGGKTIGTQANPLQTIKFTGNGEIDLSPDNGTKFYATNLDLGVNAITLGEITQHLEFSGNTTLTATGNIASVDFKGNNATINMNGGANIIGAVTNTGVATNNGTINFLGAGQIGGEITNLAMLKVGAGAVTLALGGPTVITEIQGTGINTLTMGPNFNLTGAINLTGGTALKLNFTNGGSVSGVVGTAANPVGDITTAGVTKFANSVNANGTMTFGGTTSFENTFTNTGAVNATGTTIYTGAFKNTGAAAFGGITSFADTFENTGTVILAAQSTNNFAKNVTATSFKADDATINFGNSLAFNSSLTGSGTTINLNLGQLSYTGQGGFTDKLTIATSISQAGDMIGSILIKDGSKIDLSQVNNLEIRVDASKVNIDKVSLDIDANEEVDLISSEKIGGLVPTSSSNVHLFVDGNENSFLKVTLDTSALTLSVANIANQELDKETAPGGALFNAPENIKESIRILTRAPAGTNAATFKNQLGLLNAAQQEESIDDLTPNIKRPGENATTVNTQAVSSNITSNLSSLSTRVQTTKAAVAAGEEDGVSLGVWGSPFIGNATQKMRNNTNGYKSNSKGATIGVDGLIEDDLLLGAAYTRADTQIKQKNSKVGDKSKVQSDIYSLYGLYNLPNQNWFFEGIASYGDSKIKNYSQRIIALSLDKAGYQTATGKYKSQSYTGQVMAGYNYLAPQDINLTPTVGIRYTSTKDSGYTETGTTFQNLTVKGKKYDSVDGLIGARVSQDIKVDSVVLTPTAYGMFDYSFKNKTPAIDARLQGMDSPFPTNSFKAAKASFNFGVGLTTKYQMMEYGVNYDANVASKYFAQQGSLKVRVNF